MELPPFVMMISDCSIVCETETETGATRSRILLISEATRTALFFKIRYIIVIMHLMISYSFFNLVLILWYVLHNTVHTDRSYEYDVWWTLERFWWWCDFDLGCSLIPAVVLSEDGSSLAQSARGAEEVTISSDPMFDCCKNVVIGFKACQSCQTVPI